MGQTSPARAHKAAAGLLLWLIACQPSRPPATLAPTLPLEEIQTLVAATMAAEAVVSTHLPTDTKPTLRACFNLTGLNVRSGPGVEFSDIGGLTNGQCVTLDGRNGDGSWARIRGSDSATAPRGGWVSSVYLDISGEVQGLPVVEVGRVVATVVPTVRVATAVPPAPVRVSTPRPQPPVDNGGATAICNDGWLSNSQHRRGTCSHHGGVREWLRDDIPP